MDIKQISKNKVVTLFSEDIGNEFDSGNEFINGFIVAYNDEEMVLACIDH